jgi:crotonobetainyl-CoA:carnitine CoA-transferase CaiB-like acyl-CoA transferase
MGVLAGRLLADGGAGVVRIVPPSGDPLAFEPPFFGHGGPSIQEAWYNAGKSTLELDLRSPDGRSAFLRLVGSADILVEDWSPAEAPFGPAELEQANPALTRVSVTPMGLDGPLAGWRVNDLVANAMCGSASVTGNASTPPLTGYGNQAYHTVGLYAAVCALAAHRAARATGRFQHVDLSAHEAMVSCTEQVLMEWFFPDGVWKTSIAPRQGSLHWSGAYEVYTAADGHGVMVTASLKLAEVLVPWLIEEGAAQELAGREKYPDVVAMVRNLPYVMKVLREWVAGRNGEELFFEAQRRHQPFGVVWNIEEALMKSPQIAARSFLREQDVPGFGRVPFPGRLFRTSADGPHPAPGRRVARVDWEPRVPRAPRADISPSRPLEGVRVMDFTHVLAGPFGTRVLADLGADVIKVGTAARGGGANTPDHPYYVCWNRNKRSVTINMAHEGGRRVARLLAAKSDIIIENFSAGVLKRWGLDRASLAATQPGVSVISMGGMGQDGPWKDFVTYAPTIHALTGLTYLTNPPGEHTLGYGFSLTDHLSGLAAALAALEALEYRERTGNGLSVDLSQYELGLGIMAPALLDYLANGANPEPVGNRHLFDAWAPHGMYRCAGDDRWVAIAVRDDDEWRALSEVMGRPELRSDPRFATHDSRVAHADALDAIIEAWTAGMDRYEVAQRCQAAGIAAGPVQDAADLTGRDGQLAAREFFGTTTAEGRGEYGIDRFPARFNGVRPPEYRGVRQLGADTFDVVTELLGLPDAEVAELLASGALS